MSICAAGNLHPLVLLMAEAEAAEAREHILKCLMQAPAETRAHFGGNAAAMTALNGWMKDLLATGHLVSTLGLVLKVWCLNIAVPLPTFKTIFKLARLSLIAAEEQCQKQQYQIQISLGAAQLKQSWRWSGCKRSSEMLSAREARHQRTGKCGPLWSEAGPLHDRRCKRCRSCRTSF